MDGRTSKVRAPLTVAVGKSITRVFVAQGSSKDHPLSGISTRRDRTNEKRDKSLSRQIDKTVKKIFWRALPRDVRW